MEFRMTKKVWCDRMTANKKILPERKQLLGKNKILRIEVEQNVLCTGWHRNVWIL